MERFNTGHPRAKGIFAAIKYLARKPGFDAVFSRSEKGEPKLRLPVKEVTGKFEEYGLHCGGFYWEPAALVEIKSRKKAEG